MGHLGIESIVDTILDSWDLDLPPAGVAQISTCGRAMPCVDSPPKTRHQISMAEFRNRGDKYEPLFIDGKDPRLFHPFLLLLKSPKRGLGSVGGGIFLWISVAPAERTPRPEKGAEDS